MSKTRQILLFLGVVAFCLAVVIGTCGGIANSRNDSAKPTDLLSDWMAMIDDDTLIKDIVIPGAHDAATAGMTYMAETQDRSIAEILESGVRYLDLRITANREGTIKIFHGPIKGIEFSKVLNQIKYFIAAHPQETVIVDIQHLKNDCEVKAQAVILAILQGYLVENTSDKTDDEFVDTLKLSQTRGKCLVVWGDGYEKTDSKAILKRNNDEGSIENCALQSYYKRSFNTKSSSKYIKEALPRYIENYKEYGKGLFVLQCQLTDPVFVLGPRLREARHTDNMAKYLTALWSSDDLQFVNIVLRDFVSPAKNCLALRLNLAKGNVKADLVDSFYRMIVDNAPKIPSVA